MATTLMVKEVNELPLVIDVAIPPERPILQGKFTGYAVMRSKDELKALGDRMTSGEFENNDEKLLKELFTRFDGLGDASGSFDNEKSWDFILNSKFSSQLGVLLLNRYYEGHNEARKGNSGGRR